jgi:glyoxylase-like metal-dependent hydrolase (beta-lactamase superfamily II)
MSWVPQSAGIEHGVEAIADHVFRVRLPLALPDLKVVNAYVLTGPDGITLVDPGWAYEPSEVVVRAALDALGAVPPDVRRILVTHQHWDHYSLAVRWRDRFGAELMLGREEGHGIEAFTQLAGVHPAQVGMLVRAGAPQLADAVDRLEWESHERGVAFAPPDRWLDDGDVIDCGATTIVVRATPGHGGHMAFDDNAHAMVFTGDHLLPRITPSIAFERAPEALPLRSYLSSLRLFLDLPDSRMLPAHGEADRLTRGRAQELLDHHRERLDRVADLVAAGAVTAFEAAQRMRWTRHERSLEELDIVHRMAAVLEVHAHLDLLVAQGILTVHDSEESCAFSVR